MANTEQQPEVTIQATEPTIEPATKTTNSKKRLWVIVAVAVTAGVALIVGLVIYFVLNGGAVSQQKKMESYLKEKYGQEFVVEGAKLEGATIGIEGHIIARAHPVNAKDSAFDIWTVRTGYNDEYPKAIWSKQEKEPVRQFLATVFEQMPEWSVEVNTIPALDDQIKGDIPDFNVGKEQYGSGIVYSITVKMNGDLNESNRLDHQNRVFKIIDYLKNKGIGKPSVRYVINIDNQDARYICDLYDSALKTIQSPNDLSKCFKKDKGRE